MKIRRKAIGSLGKPKVGMISLGCAKNLVDAEIMLGSVLKLGMKVTSRAEDADVLVVNTCAFIDSAKEESIEAILEAHHQRGLNRRANQKLIVSGCLSQRFGSQVREALPEVDAFIGLDQVSELGAIIETILKKHPTSNIQLPTSNSESSTFDVRRPMFDVSAAPATNHVDLNFITPRPTYIPDYDTPRFRLTPAHSAYVKIAEGCNHPCSFCVIPQMRGKHRSRAPQSVLAEIRGLVSEGVREINLISQDTTYYGMDLWWKKAGPRQPVDSTQGPTLAALLREIQKIEGEFWVRLLYTHPAHWSDELIETIAECDKVARYIDIPLQHIDDSMLGRMRRETTRTHIETLIDKLRSGIPRLPCARLSSSDFLAKRRGNSRLCSTLLGAFDSNASGYSNIHRKRARARPKCRTKLPRRSKMRATGWRCRSSNRSRMKLPAKELEANSNYWSISRISPGAKTTPRMSMRASSCPGRRPWVNSFGAGLLEAADTIF